MQVAAEEGCGYSMSLLHSDYNLEKVSDQIGKFKEKYFALNGVTPKCKVAISIICDESQRKCQEIYEQYKGGLIKINISGNASKCYDELCYFFERLAVDEIMILFLTSSFQSKIEYLETFSDLFVLNTNSKHEA